MGVWKICSYRPIFDHRPMHYYPWAVPALRRIRQKLRLWTTLTCIGHTAVAGACGEVVRKWVADSRTDSGSDTASACGPGCGSVVRIHGLMRTQYFGIRTPLELETDCDQQHAQHRSAQPRPYLSPLIAPSLRLRPGHPAQPSRHRCYW